jgi:hypothetical protein
MEFLIQNYFVGFLVLFYVTLQRLLSRALGALYGEVSFILLESRHHNGAHSRLNLRGIRLTDAGRGYGKQGTSSVISIPTQQKEFVGW